MYSSNGANLAQLGTTWHNLAQLERGGVTRALQWILNLPCNSKMDHWGVASPSTNRRGGADGGGRGRLCCSSSSSSKEWAFQFIRCGHVKHRLQRLLNRNHLQ